MAKSLLDRSIKAFTLTPSSAWKTKISMIFASFITAILVRSPGTMFPVATTPGVNFGLESAEISA